MRRFVVQITQVMLVMVMGYVMSMRCKLKHEVVDIIEGFERIITNSLCKTRQTKTQMKDISNPVSIL